MFAIIYQYATQEDVGWKDVWVGAGVTSLLFVLGRYALTIVLRFTNITSLYGAAGAFLIALMWIYLFGLLFLFGAEFMLLFVALVYTDAARAVMFLYTAPFVVALGGHLFLPGERLDLKSVIGIVLAFAGVAVALDPAASTDSDAWIGDLMALAAGIVWGLTTLVIKGSKLRYCPASQVLFYQVAVSAVMFFAGAMLFDDSPFVPMGPLAIASVLYQAVWVASITFGIWFVLIARYSPTSLSVVTFITPLFGAAFGYLFLGEMLGVEHIFAVVAVAIGILLVSLPKTPRPAAIGPEIDKNR